MVQPHLENSIQSWLPYLKETIQVMKDRSVVRGKW